MLAEYVMRIKNTRLLKCVMFGGLVGGAGWVWNNEKEWMCCFLDDLRGSGINSDQWMAAPHDKGEWRKTAEQGAERFMAKWVAAEKVKAGLRHEEVCPNVTGRAKERIAQSKRARAGSLVIVDQPQVVQTCILRVDVVLSFSGLTYALFLFRFRPFYFYQRPRLFVRSIVP